MYNAGRLKHCIEIQRPVELGVDDAGNRRTHWVTDYTVYAAARDLSGREYLAAAAIQAEHIVTLTLRYLPELQPDMRVLWQGEHWDIVQINHLGYRGDWMSIKIKRTAHGGELHGQAGV